MNETNEGSVAFSLLVDGYRSALERLEEAVHVGDDIAAQHAQFETLSWATSIDEFVMQRWAPEGKPLRTGWRERLDGADAMRGIRAARNRVHHQWADAIRVVVTVDDTALGGVHVELLWGDLDDLPAVPDRHRRREDDDAYMTHLQGRRIESALQDLLEVFQLEMKLLEPTYQSTRAWKSAESSAGSQ